MGLGGAYQKGVQEASKSFFVYIPGDNTWPYRSFLELFGNLGKADVVTSYTTNANVRPGAGASSHSLVHQDSQLPPPQAHELLQWLDHLSSVLPASVEISTRGFGFQAEILLNALYRGLSVVEVALPIDERTAGSSKAVNLKNITSVAATVIRLFWRSASALAGPKTFLPMDNWRSETNAGVEEVGLRHRPQRQVP